MPIRVTVWSENYHERHQPEIAAVYPDGIHGAIAAGLADDGRFEVRTRTQDQPDQGLGDDVLDETDVLIWWGHARQGEVDDRWATAVRARVIDGMGLIALHSSLNSKPFRAVIGSSCRSAGFRHGDSELVWTAAADHPITAGVPSPIVMADSEMYCEPFDIAQIDEVVFISSFGGGEVFRSGVTFRRGRGRVFYFGPGHEEYPIYHDPIVRRVIGNAVAWTAPAARPSHPRIGPERRDKPLDWFRPA
ncbi:ThuA domain-containing protein [Microlunatus ginsengisoli]|uniref:Trehalose utilization protein ThuA n=1 Tax=Microlunatus ginsengisoli TaxID=363863 RepID=A0ABP6ZNL9_9ACTN